MYILYSNRKVTHLNGKRCRATASSDEEFFPEMISVLGSSVFVFPVVIVSVGFVLCLWGKHVACVV